MTTSISRLVATCALLMLVLAAGCGSAAPTAETTSGFPAAGRPSFAFLFSDP